MKKLQINPRDVELLSTYLDGQLPQRAQNRLEARLEADPKLRQALAELRHTRWLLGRAPRARAPRNFTLSPEMVGQPRVSFPKLFSGFRFASAVASLLFVLVVVGDLLGIPGAIRSPGADKAMPQIVAVQESEGLRQEEPVLPPPAGAAGGEELFGETPFPKALGEYGPYGTPTESFVPPMGAGEAPEMEAPVMETAPDLPPESEAMDQDMQAATETRQAALEETPKATEEPVTVFEDAPPDIAALDEESEAVPEESLLGDEASDMMEPEALASGAENGDGFLDQVQAETRAEDPQAPDRTSGKFFIRSLEVLLGLTAIGAGIAAYYFRTKSRHAG